MLLKYSWIHGLPLKHGWLTGVCVPRENQPFLSQQLTIVSISWAWDGIMCVLPSAFWDLVEHELHRPCDCCQNCCGFICAAVPLCPYDRVAYSSTASALQWSLSPGERGLVYMFHLGLRIMVTYFFTSVSCRSVLVNIYCKQKLLWWGLEMHRSRG